MAGRRESCRSARARWVPRRARQPRPALQQAALAITGIVMAAQEEAHHAKESRTGDKVNLPTNDITMMHEAIPFLPVPVALLCLLLNVLLPGSGTVMSGVSALCMGQPRINFKEGRKLMTLIINFLVGVSQFFTITFLFVGWFWSIAWGGLIIIHSSKSTTNLCLPGKRLGGKPQVRSAVGKWGLPSCTWPVFCSNPRENTENKGNEASPMRICDYDSCR